ncbi:MAG TPA: hypothetical protein VH643_29405 [Gemmataceae bacterium]|jgi:hypothetical protein
MKKQHICLWTGGQNHIAGQCQRMAESLPDFPDPVPLAQTALIEYQWGKTHFDIFVTACSLRNATWGDEEMTWLHCKGHQTSHINPAGATSQMMVLIPAHFVTSIKTGTSYRIANLRHTDDLGVFPPNQPTPADALPLVEVERVLMELQTTERN